MLGSRKRGVLRPVDKLTGVYARSFKGGLNTLDSPLNLSSQYVTECRNLYPDPSGSLRVRFGTSLFADVSLFGGTVVNMEYYIDHIIVVLSNGKLVAIDSEGAPQEIWSSAIAATRFGAPPGWSDGLTFASFAQFGGKLIIANGKDKPLVVDSVTGTPVVNYLADAGSGSNVNVPRAKYVVSHNGYVVMAYTTTNQTMLYITSKGSSGTFVGDPPPNDAVNFDTALFLSTGLPEITGLASFRDRLIVTFDEAVMAIVLGEYSGDAHVPRVEEAVENHGAVSHRCIVPMGDDILFLDKVGIASVARALITKTFSPTRESTLVSLDLQKALSRFSVSDLSNALFAVHDRLAQQVMFFIPKEGITPDVVLTQSVLENNTPNSTNFGTLSEGNLTHTAPPVGVGANAVARSTESVTTGKWYYQVECNTLGSNASTSIGINRCVSDQNFYGDGVNGVSYRRDGKVNIGGSTSTVATLPSINDKTVDVAYDATNKRIWVRTLDDNGSNAQPWNGDALADPATGVGGFDCSSVSTSPMRAFDWMYNGDTTSQFRFNFGQRPYIGPGMPTGYAAWGYTAIEGFIPSDADNDVYVYCSDKSQKFRAMTYYDNMPYRCGCRTSDGRVFLGTGRQVYYYRNQFEPLHIDFARPDDQAWSDGVDWDDGTGWNEAGLGGTYSGTDIAFAMSTPWTDMKEPEKLKEARYLHALFEGDGAITVEQYNDRFSAVQLRQTFMQTEQPTTYDAVVRPINNDQLYAWNSKFTRARLRVTGTTNKALRIISLGLLYMAGGFRR